MLSTEKWRGELSHVLFICYIAAYLDRVNVSFAKLQMQADVPQISDTVFGLGAGIFFLGYFIFEVPSNLLMEKVGARFWIARIMVTWGIVSSAMIFVNSAVGVLWATASCSVSRRPVSFRE